MKTTSSTERLEESPRNPANDTVEGIPISAEDEQQQQQAAAAETQSEMAKGVLTIWVILKVLVSYDSGAFSAVLGADNGITDDLELSTSQQGALGSTVFLGNTVGCAIAGHLFSHYSAKKLMTLSLTAHTFLTFLFGISNAYEADMVIRFFLGVTLAFIVVYSPIWVDEFAPKTSATLWMALCNVGVPIGIMLGFVVGGMLPTNTSLSWRWAFYIKSLLMIPLTMYFNSLNKAQIDISHSRMQRTAAATGAVDGTFTSLLNKFYSIFKALTSNGLLMSNIMALSSMYFVVTALQTFVTPYLKGPPFFANMNTIVLGFGGAVVTAPVLGVVVGGVLLDRIGGYHRNLVKASLFELVWGAIAGVVGFICMTATTTSGFLVVVWLLLFCGGAIVPAATGIIMASIDENKRAAASSFSAICFNLFGYFSGPLVCGLIADDYGLEWGIRTAFIVSFLGIIPMAMALRYAKLHKYDNVVKDIPANFDIKPEDDARSVLQEANAISVRHDRDNSFDEDILPVAMYPDEKGSSPQQQQRPGQVVTLVDKGVGCDRLSTASSIMTRASCRSPSIEPGDLDIDHISNASMHQFPNQFSGALGLVSDYFGRRTPQQRPRLQRINTPRITPGMTPPITPQRTLSYGRAALVSFENAAPSEHRSDGTMTPDRNTNISFRSPSEQGSTNNSVVKRHRRSSSAGGNSIGNLSAAEMSVGGVSGGGQAAPVAVQPQPHPQPPTGSPTTTPTKTTTNTSGIDNDTGEKKPDEE